MVDSIRKLEAWMEAEIERDLGRSLQTFVSSIFSLDFHAFLVVFITSLGAGHDRTCWSRRRLRGTGGLPPGHSCVPLRLPTRMERVRSHTDEPHYQCHCAVCRPAILKEMLLACSILFLHREVPAVNMLANECKRSQNHQN